MKPDPIASTFATNARGEEDGKGNGPDLVIRTSLLGPTVVLKGDLSFAEPLVVLGQIHGTVTGTGAVLIKRNARISGDISATTIELEKGVPLDDVVLSGRIQRTRPKK